MTEEKSGRAGIPNPSSPNPDPITGTPGAHPVGVAVGAAGAGALTGAIAGSVAGPVGAVVGSVAGAIAGGIVGKSAAEVINPTDQAAYWKANHASGPYSRTTYEYDEYAPAYQYGWESYERHSSTHNTFESAEPELARSWDSAKGKSRLAWDQAKGAVRDAWHRVQKPSQNDRI